MPTPKMFERLCFGWHVAEDRHDCEVGLPGSIGLPRPSGSALRDHSPLFGQIGNRGYLVIGEAAVRLFDCDRTRSAAMDLRRRLTRQTPEDLAASLNAAFDVLVLPMAYEIAPDVSFEALTRLLEHLRIPVVTLGLGLHGEPGDRLDRFDASVPRLLAMLNDTALLFGVRAETTRQWLAGHGFDRAVALGCPSLHLYPANILALEPPPLAADHPLATGGYLLRDKARSRQHCRFFEGTTATYILQDEVFGDAVRDIDAPVLNDATGNVDRRFISDAVARHIGQTPPFSRYVLFHGLDAWRLCCAQHAVYVGDRFHGGVVALQAGRPVALFTRDVRARELSRFYGIPTIELASVCTQPLRDVVGAALAGRRIAEFVETWQARHTSFVRTLRDIGLGCNAGTGIGVSGRSAAAGDGGQVRA